jgi:hypothetical protein
MSGGAGSHRRAEPEEAGGRGSSVEKRLTDKLKNFRALKYMRSPFL